MVRQALLICLSVLLWGCGNSLEETKKALQGTWIAGAYLDSLEITRSPFRAFRALSGISDFHYDPRHDSATLGFLGGRTVGMKGLKRLSNGDLQLAGDSLVISFAGPRGADRMKLGDVELRRISHVADMAIAEYLERRLFAGKYMILFPAADHARGVVTIEYGGAVDGFGEIITLLPVPDYSRPFPGRDALALETQFAQDTLYYAWRRGGDTIIASWLQPPWKPELRPPGFPGETFALLRQSK